MSHIPEGWTDDMSVVLPPGKSPADVVEFVLQAVLRDADHEEIDRLVAAEFALSDDDANLARDRTFGGAVRAGTSHPGNRPDRKKDPIAWSSYDRCKRDPSVLDQFSTWSAKRGLGRLQAPATTPSTFSTLWNWIRGRS